MFLLFPAERLSLCCYNIIFVENALILAVSLLSSGTHFDSALCRTCSAMHSTAAAVVSLGLLNGARLTASCAEIKNPRQVKCPSGKVYKGVTTPTGAGVVPLSQFSVTFALKCMRISGGGYNI